MNNVINIGIIDDDLNKIVGIKANLNKEILSLTNEVNEKYNKYELKLKPIKLSENMNDIIEVVRKENLECLIIDYKLNSFETISYDGTEFANYLKKVIPEFPFFIVTSYEDDLFSNTLFDSYQVFDYERYIDEKDIKERDELNFKIIQQVLIYRQKLSDWRKELFELLSKVGSSAEINDRILILNRNITGYYSNELLIPDSTYHVLKSPKMDVFLDKLESLMNDE